MPNPYSGVPKYLKVDATTDPPTIEITDSDAGSRRIPDVASFGQEELPRADPKHKATWRNTIAMFVMHEAKFWPDLKPDSEFQMNKFPAGYELYVSTRPDTATDYYLIGFKPDGTRGQVFRSAAEFALHAKWIAYGRPKEKCECKYCSHTAQKILAARLKEATKHAEMPRRPGLNVGRVSKRKSYSRANDRSAKRTRLDTAFFKAKDYTRGQSHVSELHKDELASGSGIVKPN